MNTEIITSTDSPTERADSLNHENDPPVTKKARRKRSLPEEISGPLADIGIMRARLGWLLSELRDSVGLPRMLAIAGADILGSIAVTTFAYGMLFVIRTVASDGPIDLLVTTVNPDNKFEVIAVVIGVFVIGTIGASIRYFSEQAASRAAVSMATSFREETNARLREPGSRGWHSTLESNIEPAHFQLVIAAIREASVAARYSVSLAGPIGVGLAALGLVFYLEPLITLIMAPFALLNFVPVLLVGRSLDRLNARIESEAPALRAMSGRSAIAVVDDRDPEFDTELVDFADEQDSLFHDRLLQPVRLQTLGAIAGSALTVLAFSLFILLAPSVNDLDLIAIFTYAISLRFLMRGVKELSTTAAQVSRRAPAIDRYRQFHDDLTTFQERRVRRHQHHEVPETIDFLAMGGQALSMSQGSSILLLAKGRPTRALVERSLLTLERAAITGGTPIDLLADTKFEIYLDGAPREDYVVRKENAIEKIPVKVVVTEDPLLLTMANEADFQFIASNLVHALLNREILTEWDHLFSGVLVVADDELVNCGDMDWARDNLPQIRSVLTADSK